MIAAHQQFSGWTINGTVRDFRWVPFYCSIPQGGVWPTKLLIQSPVKNGRSIFNLKTARYCNVHQSATVKTQSRFPAANCDEWPDICGAWNGQGDSLQYGDNILGVHQWIDIERTYDMEKINSDRSANTFFEDYFLALCLN